MKYFRGLSVVALMLAGVLFSKLHHSPAEKAAVPAPKDELVLGALHFQPCEIGKRLGRNTSTGFCTWFDVPEDRSNPQGRHIKLRVAIVKSTAANPDPDIVTFIDGGPGGSAINDYPAVVDAFSPLRKRHHILLVDQRGTGSSNPLDCPEAQAFGKSVLEKLSGEPPDSARMQSLMQKCLEELREKADTRFYSTSEAVADLEDVRIALDQAPTGSREKHVSVTLNLVGVSYGTRVAQHYAMEYPTAVRSIILDSAVPNTLILGSEHSQSLEDALKNQLAACNRAPECMNKFGDAYQNLHVLHQRLRDKPVTVEVRDPGTFVVSHRTLSDSAFANLVRLYAYNPVTSALLPLMTDDALHGNYGPLLSQVQMMFEGISDSMNTGMGLSVICTEDADLLTPREQNKDTLLGNSLVEFYQRACPIWPHGQRPEHFHDAFKTNAPVLILSGEFDPVTPPRYAKSIAESLPIVKVLTLRGQGHAVMMTRCVPELMEKFVATNNPNSLNTGCLDSLNAIPMFIDYNGAMP